MRAMTPDHAPRPQPPAPPSWAHAVLGGLSCITCCFPLGLVSAAVGLNGLLKAKREGRSPPLQSIAALALGVLSLFIFAAVFISYRRDVAASEAQKSAALDKVATTRKAAHLDAATACTLAEALLLDTQGVGAATVTCPGALQESGQTSASLPGVVFKRGSENSLHTVCFVRTDGWIAWGALQFGACPPPPERSNEEALREAGKPLLEKVLMAEWKKELPRLNAALDLAAPDHCPELQGEAKVLDSALLGGKAGPKEWDFLSSAVFVDALRTPSARHATSALVGLGNYLVIVDSEERVLPKDLSGHSFSAGDFEGHLYVVDARAAKVLCAAPLSFTNSATLGGGMAVGLKIGPKVGVGEETPLGNLEKNADAAVSEVVKTLTGGRLHVRR
jgi:hypothetical protein